MLSNGSEFHRNRTSHTHTSLFSIKRSTSQRGIADLFPFTVIKHSVPLLRLKCLALHPIYQSLEDYFYIVAYQIYRPMFLKYCCTTHLRNCDEDGLFISSGIHPSL